MLFVLYTVVFYNVPEICHLCRVSWQPFSSTLCVGSPCEQGEHVRHQMQGFNLSHEPSTYFAGEIFEFECRRSRARTFLTGNLRDN